MFKLWQASYHSLLQIPSIRTLGGTLPLGPRTPKIKCQALPCDGPVRLKEPTPASPPVTDNLHRIGIKECRMWHMGLGVFTVNTGIASSFLTSYSEASSPNPLRFWLSKEEGLPKRSTRHFSIAGVDRSLLVSGSSWVPYTTVGKRHILQPEGTLLSWEHFNPQGFTTSDDSREDSLSLQQESSRTLRKLNWPLSLGPRGPWTRTLGKAHHYNPQKPHSQFPRVGMMSNKKRKPGRTTTPDI